MKRAIAVVLLLLVAAPVVAQNSDETDVTNAAANLAFLHDLAYAIEFQRGIGSKVREINGNDPWGTPYKLTVTPEGYRIISAGSDRKFDEASWGNMQQFDGTAGDLEFADGRPIRSNRIWLSTRLAPTSPALQGLQASERQFMGMRGPVIFSAVAMRTTMGFMRGIGARLQEEKTAKGNLSAFAGLAPKALLTALGLSEASDSWGTPMRILFVGDGYRIVSAGADRTFDEASWSTPADPVDPNADIVYDNGAFTREPNIERFVSSSQMPPAKPVSQPPQGSLEGVGRWVVVGGDVKAPTATSRVEPAYPEEMRRMRVAGLVILQVALSETGAIEDVRLLKSLTPELDTSAIEAVRRWTFAPATRNGQPVAALFNLTISFKLN